MKNYIFLVICFSFLLRASTVFNDSFPKTTSLDGVWMYHTQHMLDNNKYNFLGNEKETVLPKNWYKHGENHAGIIWYERNIQMKHLPSASNHFLEFTGVDYSCDIWVNEYYVGSHTGYFQTFDFDISPYLKMGSNTIKVKVNSPLENYPEHYSLHKTLLRGIFSHHDTRPGGAWSPEGQDKNSGGIWNHISIKSYKSYKINKLKITPKIQHSHVDLNLNFLLTKLKQKKKSSFLFYKNNKKAKEIHVSVTPSNFKGKSFFKKFKLLSNEEINLTMPLENAKLWYTHDKGFPHLYTISITVGDTSIDTQTGFKTLIQDKNEKFVLNSKPIYIKGTNYISSQYMSEMNEKELRKDLLLMRDAHINTIRVHAHIEPKRFYKLCDELGFLVWQDYNLQWGYIDTEAFQKEAIKQAKEMVDMLYNHPSIYMWSMHNEPPWNSDWMKWKYPDYNTTINKKLDDILYAKIQDYDKYHLVKKLSSNLEHPWFGWYSGHYKDFRNHSKVNVVSEYGAQAIPRMSSLKKFIPKKYLFPKTKKAKKHWEYHNYQFNWSEKNGIKLKKNTTELIKDSQNYQAKLIKYATEMLRIQKYNGTTAIFQFMFNEGWPSMNWGIVDYYRQIKPGYTALKNAYAPIIVVTKQNEDNLLEFFVVNDTNKTITGASLQVSIASKDQKIILLNSINIKPDSVQKVTHYQLDTNTTINMELNASGVLIKNYYILKKIEANKGNNNK